MRTVLEQDFCSDVGYWVHMVAHRFERAMNAELSREGLTYRQCQVLGWLAVDGPLAQFELAERMNVEPPTLVRVLDGMERGELIERTECLADRRRKVIRPTERARPIWEKILVCANRVRDRMVRGLNPDEQETLRQLLCRVSNSFDQEPTAATVIEPDHHDAAASSVSSTPAESSPGASTCRLPGVSPQ